MPTDYDRLLNAAIAHLESLQARGIQYVAVSADTLRALATPTFRAATAPIRPGAVDPNAKANAPRAPKSPIIRMPRPASQPVEPARPSNPTTPQTQNSDKAKRFSELQSRVLQCVKCPQLVATRKSVVFGVGNIDADLMFVGEAPGADEDEQGEPFVGKAGQLLTRIIETMGLSRDRVYIGNILKCRPDTPGQSAGNRKPTTEEMATCIPYLHEQIDLIQPKVLVALGATAVEGLLGKTVGITKLRGTWCSYRNIPLMPTYHPAYLLRNQALREKRKVWEDMLMVMEKLEMNISEKQRGYFLKTMA